MTSAEVQLAIYDLSFGSARSISAQFLGPDHVIDIIPHTGLVVFGKEYFFGGGIQSADPMEFRRNMGISPVQVQLLGQTTVSQSDFETWCQQAVQSGRYSAEAYDLLNRNCNNFCHDAVRDGLGISQGIPHWIIDVPAQFLASPMGQMIRPMLENMQITGPQGTTPVGGGIAETPTPAPATNPWANLPSSSPAPVTTSRPAGPPQTPLIDSYRRPLVSSDTKTASVCANKIVAGPTTSDQDKEAIITLSSVLTSTGSLLSSELVEQSSKAILNELNQERNVSYALMLLRLVVLHSSNPEGGGTGEEAHVLKCVQWIERELTDGADRTSLTTTTARSMAWCTLSNVLAVATPNRSLQTRVLNDANVEAALNDIAPDSQPRVEVRQAAAGFLYNVALLESAALAHYNENDDLSDRVVSMLLGSLNGLDGQDEVDVTTRTRRILIAARLVKPVDSNQVILSAKSLVQDLGLVDGMARSVGETATTTMKSDSETLATLIAEFIDLIHY